MPKPQKGSSASAEGNAALRVERPTAPTPRRDWPPLCVGGPGYFRCAYRYDDVPARRFVSRGFRVARTLTP